MCGYYFILSVKHLICAIVSVRSYLPKLKFQINVRSPQTNSAFQKLFGLPQEEFLINDFTCHLKRKMPLQVTRS